MNNIEPWCISRQLWWGHQIPAWYSKENKIFVAENETEANKQAYKFYKKKVDLKRDADVLDTWFSSALWPFATLGWPSKTYELKRFYPTSILVTGFDIIFFWVARMMMMGNHLLNKVPFNKVYVHALVRDEKGQKMSKSKGNVIDPLDIINRHGADSLRFTLISMAAPGRDVKLSEDRVEGYRNFLNKIWNANKFSTLNKCEFSEKTNSKKIKLDINKWIYFELFKTNKAVKLHISNFRFDEAAKTIYQFVWHSYCDWYIEFLKPIFDIKEKNSIKESRNFSSLIQSNILVMLHPFVPFLSEKLWLDLKLDKKNKSPLMYKSWNLPFKQDPSFKKSHAKIDWLIKLISSIRSSKIDLEVSPGSYIDISLEGIKKDKIKIINNNLTVFKRLGRINNVYSSSLNKNNVKIIFDAETISLYFDKDIDLLEQKEKITNKVNNLVKKISTLNKKLQNKSFLDNAPTLIVQKEKKSLINSNIELKKLNSILNSIKN